MRKRMMMISMLREKILKVEKKKLRKKAKRGVREAKEAESSRKDKKETRKERVTVTRLEDQAGLKEEGRNKTDFFMSQI